MNIAIIGASDKPDRYAHRTQKLLVAHGYRVFPISPAGKEILGAPGYESISELPQTAQPLDTITLYINPSRLTPIIADIIAAKPERVIFNPGTESTEAAQRFHDAGIEAIEACTLVLLDTGEF